MAGRTATRAIGVIVICGVLLLSGIVLNTNYSTTRSQADYNKGYQIGLEAYTYGLPLLVTDVTFKTMTSVDISNGSFGPVNQFNNVRTLNNPNSTAVVAPGANSLSSIAWLDLSQEPQVVHVPEVIDHGYVLAFIDPYTNDVLNLGNVEDTQPGNYMVVGPANYSGPIPEGVSRIDVNFNRIWIIGSTQLKGSSDLQNVNNIQDNYTITPLSQYGTNYTPPVPVNPNTNIIYYKMPSGIAFFDVLGQQLALFPPPAADQPAISKFSEVGIGPGMTPSLNPGLSKDIIRGLEDAVADGPALIKNETMNEYFLSFGKHNGYLVGGFGQYGTNYQLRAVISQIGLGAFTSEQAIFGMGYTDFNKKPLNGSSSYVLHMTSLPPVNGGWTLTAYNLAGQMIPNSIYRYQFNQDSNLTRNADGSVDIYLQSTAPTDPAKLNNWLPTPDGQGFEIIWRLLAPKPAEIPGILNGTGWQPPVIYTVA